MLAKFKNIIILSMSFDPDIITGTIKGKEFTATIKTDAKGQQYIVVDNKKIYLSQFVVF